MILHNFCLFFVPCYLPAADICCLPAPLVLPALVALASALSLAPHFLPEL